MATYADAEAIRTGCTHQKDRAEAVGAALAVTTPADYPVRIPLPVEYSDGVKACLDCNNRYRAVWKEVRKAQLATRPKCEVPGCHQAHRWNVAGALVCGRHKNKALGHFRGMGIMGYLAGQSIGRGHILAAAVGN